MKSKTPKMTKKEMKVWFDHADETRNHGKEYSKEGLKELRKNDPEKYATMKAEAKARLIELKDREYDTRIKKLILSMVSDLPNRIEKFDLEVQQEWVNINGCDFIIDVFYYLRENTDIIKNANKFADMLEDMKVVDIMDNDQLFTPFVIGSKKYYETIAGAQDKVSNGKDTDGSALKILKQLNITPEVDPFAGESHSEYLVGELFPLDGVGEVFGSKENMKTFWLQHIAFCVAHGLDFEGQPVKQGRVVYIATEGYTGVTNRFKALADHYDIEIDRDMLRLLDAKAIDLSSKTKMKELESKLEIYGKSQFMIIDILEKAASKFNMTSGDGWNTMSRNMMQYIKPHVSVLCWVAHPAKGKDRQKTYGGSGNRINHSDYFYNIDRKGEELKNTLSCHKNKDGAKFEPIDYYYQINEEFDTLVPREKNNISARDEEVLKLIEDGKSINDAIDLVYEAETKANGAVRATRSRVKKRLDGLL